MYSKFEPIELEEDEYTRKIRKKNLLIIALISIFVILLIIIIIIVVINNKNNNNKNEQEKNEVQNDEEKGEEEEKEIEREEEKEEEREEEEEEKEKEEEEKEKKEEEEKDEEPIQNHVKFNYEIKTSNTGPQNILVNWISKKTLNISINVIGLQNEIIRRYNISNSIIGEQLVKIYFGKPKLNILISRKDKIYEIKEKFNVPVEEIVIVAFQATMPTLIFSFDIFNIIKSYNCPIYIALERYNVWDWDNIPKGISTFDILDENNLHLNFDTILDKLKIWMGYMLDVNNKTFFNLYINDYHNYVIPLCIYSNSIPSDNYKIYLLSDGSASYLTFNEKYDNNETYVQNYEELKKRYKEFKDYIWYRKRYERYSYHGKNINSGELRNYIYTIIKEENNTFWWLTKIKGVFAPNNPQALEDLLNSPNIYLKDLNFLFKSLSTSEKEQIKNLFNFNSNFFEEAYQLNKSVMLIAGTNDHVEKNLIDYCLTTKLFYKDDYIYYYKAHPATPIENNPEKINRLKNINITFVDSNIPFEVIMYFNPNISCSGYYTSSFIEIDKKNLKSLFGKNKKDEEYYNKFDYFCQYITEDDEKYGKYLNGSENGTVLEINKNKLIDFKYDFGIYLKENNTIEYYKLE